MKQQLIGKTFDLDTNRYIDLNKKYNNRTVFLPCLDSLIIIFILID